MFLNRTIKIKYLNLERARFRQCLMCFVVTQIFMAIGEIFFKANITRKHNIMLILVGTDINRVILQCIWAAYDRNQPYIHAGTGIIQWKDWKHMNSAVNQIIFWKFCQTYIWRSWFPVSVLVLKHVVLFWPNT